MEKLRLGLFQLKDKIKKTPRDEFWGALCTIILLLCAFVACSITILINGHLNQGLGLFASALLVAGALSFVVGLAFRSGAL